MTRDDIARLRYEAQQHREAARCLDALARTARDRHDPLDALTYRASAGEHRHLARQADEQRREWASAIRISQIIERHNGQERED